MAAIKPRKRASIGSALNGGVLSLTKGLACDLAEKRIRVNTVVPGLMKTELWDKLEKAQSSRKSSLRQLPKSFPLDLLQLLRTLQKPTCIVLGRITLLDR